jgi:hypothetical protein
MLGRNGFIACVSATYFFLNLALNGLQINWINYTQHRFGWNTAQVRSGNLSYSRVRGAALDQEYR